MFQNIVQEEKEQDIEEEIVNNKQDIKDYLKKLFTKQNIFVYILSFMMSGIRNIEWYGSIWSCNTCSRFI